MYDDIVLLYPSPTKGRGRGKKTLAAEAAERDAQQNAGRGQTPTAAPSVASLVASGEYASSASAGLVQKSPAPRRRTPQASRAPAAELFPKYRQAIEARTLGFYQIDQRTWVAELCDLDEMDSFDGVDAWTVLRSELDSDERVSYSCAPCPDYKAHSRCVHTMLLLSDDVPPFRPFSEFGEYSARLYVRMHNVKFMLNS